MPHGCLCFSISFLIATAWVSLAFPVQVHARTLARKTVYELTVHHGAMGFPKWFYTGNNL